MRFLILRKSDAQTEAGLLPGPELLEQMGRYRDELHRAGVLVGGDGLHPSGRGARLRWSGGRMRVVDGPFAETKELIAGFLLIDVPSLEQALYWASRCPTMRGDGEVEMEVRQVIEARDFPTGLDAQLARMPWTTVSQQAAQPIGA